MTRKNIKTPVALFLDLSKAFDTLDFDILLTKLQYYGLSYNALDFIKSYLLNRFEFVKYKNTQSNLIEIKQEYNKVPYEDRYYLAYTLITS